MDFIIALSMYVIEMFIQHPFFTLLCIAGAVTECTFHNL